MNKTALQEYVEMLKKWQAATGSYLEKKTLEDCIREAEHRIDTTERQQLEDAYDKGLSEGNKEGINTYYCAPSAFTYYTTTYKTT